MYNITVLCVGKLKEKFYIDASAEYCKRLSRYCKLNLLELKEERLPENPSRPNRKRPQPGSRCHPGKAAPGG